MAKKHIITIAGSLGSGKSSTAKRIVEILGYKFYSNGDFMRSIATDRGVTLEELSKIAETDPTVDIALDDRNREMGKENDIVVDSRLGFYFIPEAFKVSLELDPSLAAARILKDAEVNPNRHKETRDKFDSPESIAKSINERLMSERMRYKELYGINDHRSQENFDLVIDTSALPLEGVAQKIVEEYKKWLGNE